jgi:acetyl-CoA synthetase
MVQNEDENLSESEIAVHWQEEDYYQPPEAFSRQANLTDEGIYRRFGPDRFPDCYTEYAELLDW